MLKISIAAEKIGQLWGLPITNSLLTTWLVMVILTIFAILATRNMTMVPNSLQSVAEMIVGGLYDFFSQIAGKHIKAFFPLIATLFLFIILANWMGLLPGVGTIGFYQPVKQEPTTAEPNITEAPYKTVSITGTQIQNSNPNHQPQITPTPTATKQAKPISQNTPNKPTKTETEFVPLFRGANADINTTLALAIITVVAIQYFGFKTVGFKYSSRFINLSNPINFFIGILEIVSELSRIISFAFRLFGNIFAGEVLLTVMAFLMPFIVPLPFMALELFVGFIQALVFSMLTAVFLNVAVSHGDEAHG